MQPRAPVSFLSFLGPEGRPQNGGFLHLIDKIADFLHNKLFFLIEEHLFEPLGMPQNGVFP